MGKIYGRPCRRSGRDDYRCLSHAVPTATKNYPTRARKSEDLIVDFTSRWLTGETAVVFDQLSGFGGSL